MHEGRTKNSSLDPGTRTNIELLEVTNDSHPEDSLFGSSVRLSEFSGFSVTGVEDCLRKVDLFLSLHSCSATQWMSLLGTLASLEQFIRLGRLHVKPLQFYLRACWGRKVHQDKPCLSDNLRNTGGSAVVVRRKTFGREVARSGEP